MSGLNIQTILVSLFRRFRNYIEDFKYFILSVITCGKYSQNCSKIAKTQDGRLQIAGIKIFPHVLCFQLFCFNKQNYNFRTFRYPYVINKNQLFSDSRCNYSFNNSKTFICINPYHYLLFDNNNITSKIDFLLIYNIHRQL